MALLSLVLPFLKRNAVTRLALSLALSFALVPAGLTAHGQGLPFVVPGTLSQASSSSGACFTSHLCGDNGPLSGASFVQPNGLAFDGSGNLFIADESDVRVRKITKGTGPLRDGIVTPFVGQSGTKCPSPTAPCGDGGPVSDPSVLLNDPRSIAFNAAGDLFIADFEDNRVRRVDHATNVITTYAGNGDTGFLNPASIEGLPATQVGIQPRKIAVAPDGTLYIVNGVSNGPILAVDPTTRHIRTYVASADSGWPTGMAVAANGDLYFVESTTNVVRKVEKSTGIITTIAGGGSDLPYNNVQLAKDTDFVSLEDLLILPSGDLLVDDSGVGVGQIFRVELSTGLLYPIAGCSGSVSTCDATSTVATRGRIYTLRMAVDAQGNIFYTSQAVEEPISEVENTPATITFADTAVNIRSSDSPQTAYLMNFGAQALPLAAGTPGVPSTYTPLLTTTTAGANNSFTLDAASTAADTHTSACPAPVASPAAIASGTTCRFNLVFQPTAAGTITGQLSIAYDGTNPVGAQQIVPLNGSTTSVTPTASATVAARTIAYGAASVNLSASLTYSDSTAPSGTATFRVNGGSAITATCTGSASPLTCTASYTTSALDAGSYPIAFRVAADSMYAVTNATGTLTVNKAAATVTLGSLSATYDGNPHAATAATTPAGLTVNFTYDGSSTPPTAAGSYAVVANVSDTNYSGTASGTLVISGPTTPTIAFAVGAHTFGDADFTVSATSNSPRALTYSVVSGPATLTGTTVHLTGAGTVILQASQAASGSYSATTKNASFNVNKATATVTLGSLTATYDGNPHSATAVTAPAGLTVGITYDGSSTPPSAAGSYAVLATVSDANYTGTASGTLVISALTTPTITFAVGTHTFGDADFTVSATSNSPGALTYSVVSGPATLSGTTVHLTGAGSVILQVSQAASGSYSATTKNASFNVNKGTATVTLGSLAATYDGNPHAATVVTSPAGLSAGITYDGSSTPPSATGSYAVVATVTDANYTGTASGTLVISALTTPTIAFAVGAHTFGDADFTASATSNSSGAFTYSVVSGPATLTGTTVHLTGAGSVTLQASQAASGSYSATTKTATFTVNKASATVTLGSLNATYDGNPHAATVVTSPAGLSASITYDGSSTPPSAAGSYAVVATITDANYAGTASGTLVISSATAPTIAFAVANHIFGDADFNVSATSNSPGALTYQVISGPATLSGTTAHLTGAGSVTLQVSQAASGSYSATTKTATFTVAKATPLIQWPTPAAVAYGSTIGAAQLNATATGVGGAALAGSFVYTPAAGSAAVQTPSQTLQVVFTPSDTANYTTATASVSLPISSAVLDVTANGATRLYGTANPAFSGTITGQQNGDTFTETFSTNATLNSNAGSYAILPVAAGANLGRYTQQIHGASLIVTRAPVRVTAVSSVASPAAGQNFTLTATVLSTTIGTPTGTVQLLDNGAPITTATLNGPQATLSTSVTRAGTHVLSFAYSGDINFLPLTTTVQTFTVEAAAQDFTLTLLSSPTAGLHVGDTGTYQLRVAPPAGQTLAADLNLSYSGEIPVYATGQFSPAKVNAGAAATTITFRVITTKLAMRETLTHRAVEIAVALLLPFGLLRRRRAFRGAALAVMAVALLFASSALTGCGTGYPANTVPITITAQSSNGIAHTVTLQANVLQTAQ